MPYRLGFPTRKFVCTFFDPHVDDDPLPYECSFFTHTYYDKSPEDVVQNAQYFAAAQEVELRSVAEVFWEDVILFD